MKPQDILFIVLLAFLIWKRNPRYLVIAGLVCLAAAIPLFQLWIFFTAQHLVWYAAAFFLIAAITHLISRRK